MTTQRLIWALVCCSAIPACFEPARDEPLESGGLGESDGGSTTAPAGTSGGPSDAPSASGSSSGASGETGTGMEEDDDIDFFDDFDTDLGRWMFSDDLGAIEEGPGVWTYADGDLVQTSDVSGPDGITPADGTRAWGGETTWEDYEVTAAFTADDAGVVGIYCNVAGPNDWTRFVVDDEAWVARLVQSVAGQRTVLAENPLSGQPPLPGTERTLSLRCEETFRGSVDGQLVLTATGTPGEGQVGMFTSRAGDGPLGVHFHWIDVLAD